MHPIQAIRYRNDSTGAITTGPASGTPPAGASVLRNELIADPGSYTGGYTAVMGAGQSYNTIGGLDIDDDMRVLDNNPIGASRQPIPGLYAVGNESLAVMFHADRPYAMGNDMNFTVTSGRLAGEHAANFVKNGTGDFLNYR